MEVSCFENNTHDFEFLPVCFVKSSRAALIKHNCEFSIHKY